VATLYQKVENFDIFGAAFPPPVAIEVKFCTAKWTHVPFQPCQVWRESVQRVAPAGRKTWFLASE